MVTLYHYNKDTKHCSNFLRITGGLTCGFINSSKSWSPVGISKADANFFFKKIILDECSTVFEMDQVRSWKAGWVGQMMAKWMRLERF